MVASSASTRPGPVGTVAEAPPAVGALVAGKYRVEAVLGAGGSGVVLRARNELTGRAVALKMLHGGQDAQGRARFLREARAAGRIRHGHVADVLDVVDDPEHGLLLVLELLEGETVAQRLARRGPMTERDALRVGRDVADALAAAHAAGVVHRDLKPGNVFLAQEGGVERVAVLDFGIAHVADEPERLTRSDQVVGTPHYMSPEQVLGAGPDARSDVWALGVTLYELLSGAPPFERATASALFVAIATEPVPPLAPRAPELSPETRALVMDLLAKSASERPDAAQARARLEARLSAVERGAEAPAGRTAERAVLGASRPRPSRVAVWIAGIVVISVLLGALGWAGSVERSPPSAPHGGASTPASAPTVPAVEVRGATADEAPTDVAPGETDGPEGPRTLARPRVGGSSRPSLRPPTDEAPTPTEERPRERAPSPASDRLSQPPEDAAESGVPRAGRLTLDDL